MSFDVNTITGKGAELLAAATAQDRLILVGCDATTDILTQEQAVVIQSRPSTPVSNTTNVTQIGATSHHVMARAEFEAGVNTGGDVNSLFLYGHIESDPSNDYVIAIASSADSFHLPEVGDVIPVYQALFDFLYSAVDGSFVSSTTATYTTLAEFDLLKDRVVTTHAEGLPTTGENQSIYGNKTFLGATKLQGGVTGDTTFSASILPDKYKATPNKVFFTIDDYFNSSRRFVTDYTSASESSDTYGFFYDLEYGKNAFSYGVNCAQMKMRTVGYNAGNNYGQFSINTKNSGSDSAKLFVDGKTGSTTISSTINGLISFGYNGDSHSYCVEIAYDSTNHIGVLRPKETGNAYVDLGDPSKTFRKAYITEIFAGNINVATSFSTDSIKTDSIQLKTTSGDPSIQVESKIEFQQKVTFDGVADFRSGSALFDMFQTTGDVLIGGDLNVTGDLNGGTFACSELEVSTLISSPDNLPLVLGSGNNVIQPLDSAQTLGSQTDPFYSVYAGNLKGCIPHSSLNNGGDPIQIEVGSLFLLQILRDNTFSYSAALSKAFGETVTTNGISNFSDATTEAERVIYRLATLNLLGTSLVNTSGYTLYSGYTITLLGSVALQSGSGNSTDSCVVLAMRTA